MLLLEDGNRIIKDSLRSSLEGYGLEQLCSLYSPREASKDILDLNFCDFGETRYHLWSDEGNLENISLSMAIPGAKELFALGLEGYLSGKLPGIQMGPAESGFHLSLRLGRSTLAADEPLIAKVAMLRKLCLGLPLELAMDAQKSGKETAVMAIPLRDTDVMYVKGTPDRTILVLSTKFDDPSDAVLGKVFMQVPSGKSILLAPHCFRNSTTCGD